MSIESNYPVSSFENIIVALENDDLIFKNSIIYKPLLIETLNEIKEFNIAQNNGEDVDINSLGFDNRKYLILDVVEDMFITKGKYEDIDSFVDKKLIEEFLNRITNNLEMGNYSYDKNLYFQNFLIPNLSSLEKNTNDYMVQDDIKSKTLLNGIDLDIFKVKSNEQQQNVTSNPSSQIDINYKKHTDKKFHKHNMHNKLYSELLLNGLYIWKDASSLNLYFRIKPYSKKHRSSKEELSDYLLKVLGKTIDIYKSIDDIKFEESTYLIIALLPVVKMEVFNPKIDIEFPYVQNNMVYKNTFQSTDFLKKRLPMFILSVNIQKSIIYQFIKELSQNELQFNYIINWLAQYFQNLTSSKMALTLIGDKETTDTLIYDIIRPIFAFKNDYISKINDDVLKNESFDFIVRDRLFYHVDDISTSNAKDKNTSNMILEILKSKYQNAEDAWENNESFINGELIITSSKNSPYPFLKDSYSRCTVFKVKQIDTIAKTLKIDRATLNEEIRKDLEHFSNILALHSLGNSYCRVIETPEKNVLYSMKNGVLRTPELNNQIDSYIEAIRLKKLNFFQNIKGQNIELYKELEVNFKDDMIAQPLLSIYFNLIYDDMIFSDNSSLLEILKERSEMFKKTPSDQTKYNGKKRYRIF